MKALVLTVIGYAFLGGMLPVPVRGALLDFERVYGAIPSEGMAISNQFAGAHGIRFWRLDDVAFPIIAEIGAPGASFGHSTTPIEPDTLTGSNAAEFGRFFLTDSEHIEDGSKGLMLRFDAAVSNVSLYVFDLDADERVTLTAFASELGTSGLATNVFWATNTPGAGGGSAVVVAINTPARSIRRLEVRVQGRGGEPHVGFDNFTTDYVPPAPAQAALSLRMLPALTISGSVGRTYRIDYATRLDVTDAITNWHTLTTLVLPASPFRYIDTLSTPSSNQRFYRAVALP